MSANIRLLQIIPNMDILHFYKHYTPRQNQIGIVHLVSSFVRWSSMAFAMMSLACAMDCHSSMSTARPVQSSTIYCIDSKSSVYSLTPPAGPWLSPLSAPLYKHYLAHHAPCQERGPFREQWQRPSWSRPLCTTCDSVGRCTCRQQRHNQPVQNSASLNISSDLGLSNSTLIVHNSGFFSNFPLHYLRLLKAI